MRLTPLAFQTITPPICRGRDARGAQAGMTGNIEGGAYDPEEEVVRGRLDRYIDTSAKLMALISFGSIFFFKFDIRGAFGLDDVSVFSLPEVWAVVSAPGFGAKLQAFLASDGLAVTLFAFTALWYSWYIATVKKELGIMSTLFARLNPPREYEALSGGGSVPVLAVALTVSFILLALLTDQLAFYGAVVLALNALDYRGNAVIRDNLRKFLDDPALKPAAADPESALVLARRRAAEVYWLERWQLERIVIMMIGNLIAMALAAAPLFGLIPPEPLESARLPLAYAIIIVLIVWNQWVLRGWRAERDAELRRINREERRALYPSA